MVIAHMAGKEKKYTTIDLYQIYALSNSIYGSIMHDLFPLCQYDLVCYVLHTDQQYLIRGIAIERKAFIIRMDIFYLKGQQIPSLKDAVLFQRIL